MFRLEDCSIGILRPIEASHSRLLQHKVDAAEGHQDIGETEWSFMVERVVESIRDMLVQAAQDLMMGIAITEYQLHNLGGSLRVMGHKRSRMVRENTMLVTVNPSPSEYRFAVTTGKAPTRRTIAAFTSADVLDDIYRLLGYERIAVFDSDDPDKLNVAPHVFPMYIPPNEEEAADRFESCKGIAANALLYPHTDIFSIDRSSYDEFEHIDPDSREASPEFRKYLVEPGTDAKGDDEN